MTQRCRHIGFQGAGERGAPEHQPRQNRTCEAAPCGQRLGREFASGSAREYLDQGIAHSCSQHREITVLKAPKRPRATANDGVGCRRKGDQAPEPRANGHVAVLRAGTQGRREDGGEEVNGAQEQRRTDRRRVLDAPRVQQRTRHPKHRELRRRRREAGAVECCRRWGRGPVGRLRSRRQQLRAQQRHEGEADHCDDGGIQRPVRRNRQELDTNRVCGPTSCSEHQEDPRDIDVQSSWSPLGRVAQKGV
mmetsp:Transcript_60096/g.152513  ORF Transcript_60096/g.152513 Transcript_60096/m.152513 type:complete len:249 (+) Transcript_60096:341-1087(+)